MATLKDVAREAGLSVGTVSRVLNDRGYISEDTRKQVQTVMKKLNYQPNAMARSLSKQSSTVIGVIVPSISHPYFAKLLSCLEQAAHAQGYQILLFCSQGKVSREEEYVRVCSGNRVAGLILCSGGVATSRLHDLGFPVVTFERFMNSADAGVECDNYEGGRLAAEELIGAGCRSLLCIRGRSEVLMPADARLEGFMQVCRQFPEVRVQAFSCSPERMEDLNYTPDIRSFLKQSPGVDGIFADSDVIGVQAVSVLLKMGLGVPEDVKVIGYDDVNAAQFAYPHLTTIHQPLREMADTCIDIIRRAKEGESLPVRTTFRVSLVRRDTTRKAVDTSADLMKK